MLTSAHCLNNQEVKQVGPSLVQSKSPLFFCAFSHISCNFKPDAEVRRIFDSASGHGLKLPFRDQALFRYLSLPGVILGMVETDVPSFLQPPYTLSLVEWLTPQMLSSMGAYSAPDRVMFIFTVRIQNLVCTIQWFQVRLESFLIDDPMKDFIS